MDVMHTLHDGSKVLKIPVSKLLAIPVWQGNRIINHVHVETIARSIKMDIRNLDFGYRTVRFLETDANGKEVDTRMIVDGQHRQEVLKQYFNNPFANLTNPVGDFDVIVIEKDVNSELEIIEYFNTINAVNPIVWSDKNLVVNAYLAELEYAFNSVKLSLIRKGVTRRPFLSADKLRQVLIANEKKLYTRTSEIKNFVRRVQEWNRAQLAGADIKLLGMTDPNEIGMLER